MGKKQLWAFVLLVGAVAGIACARGVGVEEAAPARGANRPAPASGAGAPAPGAGSDPSALGPSAVWIEEPSPAGASAPKFSPARFADLGIDASAPRHLAAVQRSTLSLDAAERRVLRRHGFAMSPRQRPLSFATGLAAIYKADLPLYVSADAILDAMHRSYDDILVTVEFGVLRSELEKLLGSMRAGLEVGQAKRLGPQAEADADLYLAVAQTLLTDAAADPVRGAAAGEIASLVDGARQARGMQTVSLMGSQRELDFSQFKVRGHYTRHPVLGRYFRAMMWLGRIDVRITSVDDRTHAVELDPRQVRAMLAMRALLDDEAMARWSRIDRFIGAFVGERDSMSFSEVDALVAAVGAKDVFAAAEAPGERWAAVLRRDGYGKQQIASHIHYNSRVGTTRPLERAFSPLGQRFVPDSKVLSDLSYDRLSKPAPRLMPSPFDVAYATFGNAQAKTLLAGDLARYDFEPELDRERARTEQYAGTFWDGNLYNIWISALRSLSPGATDPKGLPRVAKTEAWGRRMLGTQLASWAELRHDTILYAKQSYSSGILCEFPDAYVDPYPEFFARIERYAGYGEEIAKLADEASAPQLAEQLRQYFGHVADVAGKLRGMAEHQRAGTPFSKEQMKFINETVQVKESGGGCGPPTRWLTGWYARLFFTPERSLELDPTIADVHTQPTDLAGNPVGHVLHVGTGRPRYLYVTADTCKGPSLYVGLASSYYETITKDFERLNDEEWATRVDRAPVPGWMEDLIGG